MRVVHVQTTIQTVFGVLDDDGNVIPQEPVTVQVSRFASDSFVEAYTAIAGARDKALANSAAEQADKAQRTRKK
jgi:hypothetical protein